MKLLIIGLLVGLLTGLVSALCGVGGGIIMVPAFVLLLNMGQKAAVATSLVVVVVSALSGTMNHVTSKSGLIDWRVVGVTALGAAVAAWYGTDLMRSLSAPMLTKIFGVVLVVVGVKMLLVKA